jgi:hypothetical protein
MRWSYWFAIGVVVSVASHGLAQPPLPPRPSPWPNKLFVPDIATNRTQTPPQVLFHDFGEVPHGTVCSHTFKLTNIYMVPLQIMEVRTASTYLKFTASTRLIPTNETEDLTVTMDTGWFVGTSAQEFKVKIGPNPIDYAVFQVKAVSKTDVKISPGAVAFGTVAQGTNISREVKLEYRGRAPSWKVTEMVPVRGPLEVQVVETSRGGLLRGGVDYTIAVNLKASAPIGPVSEIITLKTNDPHTPEVHIAVTGVVAALLELDPIRPRIEAVPVGQSGLVRVYVRAAKPFRIEEIKGTDATLSVEPLADAALPVQVLTLKFKPAGIGVIVRQLRIRTDLDGGTTAVLRIEAEGIKASVVLPPPTAELVGPTMAP